MPRRAVRVVAPFVLGVPTYGTPYEPAAPPVRRLLTASPKSPAQVHTYPDPRPVWTQWPNIPKQWAPLPSQGSSLNDG
jgi:hypothetical protein